MKESIRLVTYGYFGAPFPPPLSYNLTAGALWERTGGAPRRLTNVVRLEANGTATRGRHYPASVAAPWLLRLRHERRFLDQFNGAANWTSRGAAPQVLRSNPFDGSAGETLALAHLDSTPNSTSEYLSRGLPLSANRPFCLNAYCYGPAQGAGGPALWQLRAGRFCFQLRAGHPEALWLSEQWTQEREDELHALWALRSLTGAQLERRDALLAQLYEVYQPLALGGREAFEARPFSLDFMPEGWVGRVGIESGSGRRAVLHLPAVAEGAGPRVLWNDGRLAVRCSGGAYFWQVGFPQFDGAGELVAPVKTPVVRADLGLLSWALNQEVPPGTATSVESRSGETVYDQELVVHLQSDDGSYSPLVYGAAVDFAAGERSGDEAVSGDSDQHLINGCGPVLEARPLWDENGAASWQITLPLLAGRMLNDLPGFNYPYLEDRMASLWIGGRAVVTQGIVTAARITDLAAMTPNRPPVEVENAHSELTLTLCDGWAMCAETRLTAPPVGDYVRAGSYARRLLRACGFFGWQIAGVEANSGALIGGAAVGQDWAELPAQYAPVAGVLRGLEQKYGLGRRFVFGADGIWRFLRPSSEALASLSSAAAPSPLTDAGRAVVLRPLDWGRGDAGTYNAFVVVGAPGADGAPLSSGYADNLSRYPSNNAAVLNFRGRWRLCPPLIDPALRSREACDIALRSLRELYQTSGRSAQFETYFAPELRPGDLISVDGRSCRIVRASGSWAEDTLQLLVREEA